MLSEQVQAIVNVKEGKVDFEKLLEAVRNDNFFNGRSESSAEEEDNYDNNDFENYPDEYWEIGIHDITDKAVGGNEDDNVIL